MSITGDITAGAGFACRPGRLNGAIRPWIAISDVVRETQSSIAKYPAPAEVSNLAPSRGHFPAPAARPFRLSTAVSGSDEGAEAGGSNETLSRSTEPRFTASDPQIPHRPCASNSIQMSQFAHHHGSFFTRTLIAESHDLDSRPPSRWPPPSSGHGAFLPIERPPHVRGSLIP